MLVTCPRCATSQRSTTDGYTCERCGSTWVFVACDDCAARFHMRPGTTEWTCPECGHEHGGVTMGELAPDDIAPPHPAGDGAREVAATAGGARGTRTEAGRRPTRERLALIAVIGIVAVIGASFALSALGATGASTDSTSPPASLSTTEALCLHLRDLQTLREDALTRLAGTLAGDADAVAAGGDADLAAKVRTLRRAVLEYRDALAAQADTTEATDAIAAAYSSMPC
jgi:ribosomal protein L37AE/L43A